jgi:proteasome lid subunit RPN8/RPN11
MTKLIIPDLVYRQLMFWVDKSPIEISGLGKVTVEGDSITVVSVMLLPQKNSAVSTDIDGVDIAKAMHRLRDTPGELRFWWHSHVNMDTFWSGTDRTTIQDCGAGGWTVATVLNKKRQFKTALYVLDGIKLPWGNQPFFDDNIPTEILKNVDPTEVVWEQEYERNIVPPEPPSYQHFHMAGYEYGHQIESNFKNRPYVDTNVVGFKQGRRGKHKKKGRPSTILTAPVSDDMACEYSQEDFDLLSKSGLSADDIINTIQLALPRKEVMELVGRGWSYDEIQWMQNKEHIKTNSYDTNE